jgi:hypothetical protein
MSRATPRNASPTATLGRKAGFSCIGKIYDIIVPEGDIVPHGGTKAMRAGFSSAVTIAT